MWKSYPQPSRRQAMKDMELMQEAIKNPNPCLNKDTTRWKEGERKLYKVNDGRKIYETLQRKKDNIKLSKAIFRIKTENRKDRSVEVGPGWRQGPSGLIIDCYETQKFGAKEFGALHGREYKMKKELKLRKLMDEELAHHIALYKSEYSVKNLQEDYSRKRNLVSKTPRVDPTAINLNLYGPNAKKKNTVVRGLVKMEPKELDLPEWNSSPTKVQERKKSVYTHALAMQKFNITMAPTTVDCSKFSPPCRVIVNKLGITNDSKFRPKSAAAVKLNIPKDLTEISYVSTGISRKLILPCKEFNQPYPIVNISDEELIQPSKNSNKHRPISAHAILTKNKDKESLKYRILHGREQNSSDGIEDADQVELKEDELVQRFLQKLHNAADNFIDYPLLIDDDCLLTNDEAEQYIVSYVNADNATPLLSKNMLEEDPEVGTEIKQTLYNSNTRRSYLGSCEVPIFCGDDIEKNKLEALLQNKFNFTVDIFDVGFNFSSENAPVLKTSVGIFLEGKPCSNGLSEIPGYECVEFIPLDTLLDVLNEVPDLHNWLTCNNMKKISDINVKEEIINISSEFILTNSLIDMLDTNLRSQMLHAISLIFSVKITKQINSDEYSAFFVH